MDDAAELSALEGAKAAYHVAFANWEAAYTGWRDAASDERQEAVEELWWYQVVTTRADLIERRGQLKRALAANGETWEHYLHPEPEKRVSRFLRKLIAYLLA